MGQGTEKAQSLCLRSL